jgi:anti-sigma factor RsiW
MTCKAYEHRLNELEDHLQGRLDAARSRELESHFAGCAECRAALELAALSSRLLRAGEFPAHGVEASPPFWTRLRATLRAEQEKRSRRGDFAGALEWLAWRMATAAVLATVVLGGYVLTHPLRPMADNRPEVFQEPEHPGNEDEVLVTLAARRNGGNGR